MRFGLLVAIVIIAGGFIFWKDIDSLLVQGQQFVASEEKTKSNKKSKETAQDIRIAEKWELPAELKEVSGIAYLDENRFACIQDEEGAIFIYNRAKKEVEKKIPFAGPGDYEGITLNGNTAYVVRANGKLYEVNMNGSQGNAKEYSTPLTVEHNVEGLCYDGKNNRLLLAIKDDEPNTKDYKGIYAFDLAKKSLAAEPVIRIDMKHNLFGNGGGKKDKGVKPSSIGIHPKTGELYITDGPKSRLLIMQPSGEIEELHTLGKEFAQPEGITFSPQGEMFISNEGAKGSGNIMQVELK